MKFVSYTKKSKKEQRAINAAKRGSWYGLFPVTRITPDKKTKYSRSAAKQRALREEGDY